MSVPVKRRRCSVSCCKPSDRDAECISSHGVPEDNNLRASWLEAIGCSSSDTFFRVCSRHFAPDAFKPRTGARLQLKPGVIPTLFLPTATAAAPLGKDVPGHSDTPEIESILPDDGLGWGSSSDNSSTEAVTIKTEPPEYVEQDEEPSSLVPAFTKDYTDMTKVTFHFNAEPQVSEETGRSHSAAVAVKIEPPDPTEVHTKAASTGTARQSGTIPANARLGLCSESYPNGSEILRRILSRGKTDRALLDAGLDASSANTVMTAVTIKKEPECCEEVWEPRNPVPALTKGEPPDPTDVTEATFHTNPELQVSKEAQERGNAAVAVKIGLLSQCRFIARCHSECWNHLCFQSLKIRWKSTLWRFLWGQVCSCVLLWALPTTGSDVHC
uniref:Putative purinergic receptor p2x n=1 Tax=Ixodes ricinus TaxID=34613 RepID=A0A6B0VAY7_IXORI